MAKAILVLDRMPKKCYECPYCRGYYTCDVYHYRDVPSEIAEEGRPYWCPLKEMPRELPITADIDYITGYNTGWNDCIQHIEED